VRALSSLAVTIAGMTTTNYVQAAERHEGIRKLDTYGNARDRQTDREPRTVSVTDDEALAIVAYVRELEAWSRAMSGTPLETDER